MGSLEAVKLRVQYGENGQINDGDHGKSLAVKCVSGTFAVKLSLGPERQPLYQAAAAPAP